MSTLTGQSDRQPLHARHRSRASRTSVDRQPSVIGESSCPRSISQSSRARPRVEWCSSPVARYEGHMTSPSVRRHRPTPMQRSTARVKRPSSDG